MPTLDRQVGAGTDDCRVKWDGSDWELLTSSTQLKVGYQASDNFKLGGGIRFTNITIPQGATITTAYLTLTCSIAQSNTEVNTKLRGQDSDNASAFSTYADYSGRARTSAQVTWNNVPAWTADTEYNSPEIKTIIQEIVDRPGWSSGNALVVFWDDHDDLSTHNDDTRRTHYGYANTPSKAAKLHIEYAAAGRSQGHITG